jgi:hypothetical protein
MKGTQHSEEQIISDPEARRSRVDDAVPCSGPHPRSNQKSIEVIRVSSF